MLKYEILVRQYYRNLPVLLKRFFYPKYIETKMEFHIDTDKNEPTSPPPWRLFVVLIKGVGVCPVCNKVGILFNIEKGVCQNALN